jgi:CBS domain-containing protein
LEKRILRMLEEWRLDLSLNRLFPNLFGISRPLVTPDVPVMVAASILSIYEAPMLPIVKVGEPSSIAKEGVKLFRAIGGEPIIQLLIQTRPEEHYKSLWLPCTSASVWIGSIRYDGTLDELLRIFELTRRGDARVDAPDSPPALVTLQEVIGLYRERKLTCSMTSEEVASECLTVAPDDKLFDAMATMCEKKVRRLFLRGKKGEFISDRAILAFLFSPKGLKSARDSPGFWSDLSVSDIEPRRADSVSPQSTVEDIGALVDDRRDVFVLSDRMSVISRWDLVMKPWRAQRLRVSL